MDERVEFDVTVIGAGIAGMVAAVTANGLGKKVAIIEKRTFGGNCSSFTCLPTKVLIRAGHVAGLLQNLAQYGLRTGQPMSLDTGGLIPHVKSLTNIMQARDAAETFEAVGIKTFSGPAGFRDPHRVTVNGRDISSRSFIIATGTRPMLPPIEGLQEVPFLTNETLFELETLPESMIILGGGVSGLEYASSLTKLGVAVTLVEMGNRLLPNDDRELVNRLTGQLQKSGIRLLTGTRAAACAREGDGIALSVEYPGGVPGKLEAESLLITIGRKANLEGLSLDKAGVKFTPRGIIVNETMQTSIPHIYACGDIAGPYQLASAAEYQGIIAGTNAILPLKRKTDFTNAVFVIFTEPGLARLGMTEQQARKKYNDNIRVYRFDYGNLRRALIDRTESGLAKIICDRRGRLVGAHILGEAAPELIHELQLIKSFHIPLQSVQSLTHAYPTYAQALIGRASQLAYLDNAGSNFLIKQFFKFVPGYQNRIESAKRRLAEDEKVPSANLKTAEAGSLTETSGQPSGMAEMKVFHIGHNICLIELRPVLGDPDEKPLLNRCPPPERGKKGFLLLDFSGVNFINGLGASMLVKLAVLAGRRGQKTAACGVNSHYRGVFRTTGLDRAMSVYASREEALASLSGSSPGPQSGEAGTARPQDTAFWARPVNGLEVPPMPPEAINLNMRGRKVVGPVLGFGQLWQKRYRLAIDKPGLTPEEIIRILKQDFPSFQPSFNRFYPSPEGIRPGEVVAIDSSTAGGPVSTGVMVLFADDTSFTFITPQGHPESGWVTFSALKEGGKIIVQILGLARANDPVYEAAFRAVGSKLQMRIWAYVLNSLAVHLGVPADVTVEPVRIDPAVRWSQAGNIWYNAQIRTLFYMPVRRLLKVIKKGPHGEA